MADPVSLLVMVAVSAAISAGSYAVQYFLSPKPKGQERGRLQGELQVQDSTYGPMIPLVYGGDPEMVAEAGSVSFVAERRNYDFQAGGGGNPDIGQIEPPVGVQDGDYLLVQTLTDDGASFPPDTPAGWTKLEEQIVPYETGTAVFTLFGKFYDSGDTTPYNFYPTPGPVYMDVIISAWRGVHTSSPVNDSSSYGVETDGLEASTPITSIPVPAISPSVANCRIVAIGEWRSGDVGVPAGYTSHLDNSDSSIASKTQATIGSTGQVDVPLIGFTGNDIGAGFLVALRPAPAVSGVGGGGVTVAGNVIYLSDVRAVVTETPAEGGKGGPSAPPTKSITYYCDIGIKFGEGRLLMQKLFADAEPLLDFTNGTTGGTGLVNPTADPEPSYSNLNPIDPNDPDVATRRESRYGLGASYDSNGVLSGTLKDGATFRFYQGTDTQPADPLYQTYFQSMFPVQHAAGKVVTPTHKGDCLLFIQNFNVSAFGRIPSFRAKLSNADLYTVDTIIDDLAQRVGLESADLTLDDIEDLQVRGLPVFNRNGAAEAIATLQLVHGFDLVDADSLLEAVLRGGAVAGEVLYEDLGSNDSNGDDETSNQPVRSESEINVDLTQLPQRLDLNFLSAAKDGESGTVGFSRLETDAKTQESQELNCVLRDDEAQRVMRRLLDTIWSEARATRKFSVPHTYYQIKPGRAWTVPVTSTTSERVRVTEVNGFLPGSFDCVGVVESSRAHTQTQIAVTGSAAEAGGIIPGHAGEPPTLKLPNTSVVTFIDRILRDRERQDGRPGYYVGARGFSSDPWGGCTIKRDRGAGYERIIDLTEPATLGVIVTAPATLLVSSTIEVDLYEGGTLPSFTAGEVSGGQGYVIAGDLVFQYQTATQLSTSPNRWELSDISNIGAECSTNGSLATGQRFALLNQAFRFVAIESEEIDVARDYIAQSSGQNEADCAVVSFTCTAPNLSVTTPADYNMTAGDHEIIHSATPVSPTGCQMVDGLYYEIREDVAGSPGDLIYSGAALPYKETGLEPGSYTRHFRARTKYKDGAYVTDTVTVLPIPGPSAFIEDDDFVTHFYQGAFARDPTGTELSDELALLAAAADGEEFYLAAYDIGDRLFHSAEYLARGRDDEEFVTDLYRAYMARVPDDDGFEFWLDELASSDRDHLIEAFGDSPEFRLRAFNVYGWHPEESGGGTSTHWEPLVENEELLFDVANGDLLGEFVAD